MTLVTVLHGPGRAGKVAHMLGLSVYFNLADIYCIGEAVCIRLKCPSKPDNGPRSLNNQGQVRYFIQQGFDQSRDNSGAEHL